MNRTLVIRFALSAVLLGGVAVGCKPSDHPATLSAAMPRADRRAARLAGQAGQALARNDAAGAVRLAEGAVALAPRAAAYRLLLGRAYLAAGRFVSAEAVLAGALLLQPDDGQTEMSLALARIALGRWDEARMLLASARGQVGESDRGLALALAGDRSGGVAALEDAARATGADAKARQNLALGYALAGRWADAASIAGQDLPPAQVRARMIEWADLSQPHDARDQVAALLHVTPVEDGGMPATLALAASPASASGLAAAASPVPAGTVAPGTALALPPADAAPADAGAAPEIAAATRSIDPVAAAAPAAAPPALRPPPALVAVAATTPPPLIAAPRPARRLIAAAHPLPLPASSRRGGAGRYVVQLGAFARAGNVAGAWRQAVRQARQVARFAPSSATFATERAGTVYRLSVAGFATREAAGNLCRQIRVMQGACFVRANAGDALAAWAAPGMRLASR